MIGRAFLKHRIAPLLTGAMLVASFAIPGSDQPKWALLISVSMALLCAGLWIAPRTECPPLIQRRGLRMTGLLFAALILLISLMPLATLTGDGFLSGFTQAFGDAFDASAACIELCKLGAVACAFMAGLRLCLNDEDARRTIDVLLVFIALWACVCIVMQLIDPDRVYGVTKMVKGRLTGAFSSANSAATLFGSISVITFGRLIGRFSLWDSHIPFIERIDPFYGLIFTPCFTALVLTLSRTGLAVTVFCIAALTMAVWWRRKSAGVAMVLLIAGIAAASGMLASPLSILMDRFKNLHEDIAVRQMIMSAHLEIAEKRPWFGTGLGSFNAINSAIVNDQNYNALSLIRAAHSVYLQWFEETGIVGVSVLVLLNLAILVPILLAALRRQRMSERLWGILFAYGVFLLHGLTDYAFQEQTLALYAALLLGIGYAVSSNVTPPPVEDDPEEEDDTVSD